MLKQLLKSYLNILTVIFDMFAASVLVLSKTKLAPNDIDFYQILEWHAIHVYSKVPEDKLIFSSMNGLIAAFVHRAQCFWKLANLKNSAFTLQYYKNTMLLLVCYYFQYIKCWASVLGKVNIKTSRVYYIKIRKMAYVIAEDMHCIASPLHFKGFMKKLFKLYICSYSIFYTL